MKRFAAKIQRKCAEPIPKGCAIFLMIAGIFLGSVFLYGAYTSKVLITRADAVSVTAEYVSCRKIYSRGGGGVGSVILYFADHEPLTIDCYCLYGDAASQIEAIKPGTSLTLRIQPGSDMVLEMVSHGKTIIDFDQATVQRKKAVSGDLMLTVFLYLGAAIGVVKLLKKEVYSLF